MEALTHEQIREKLREMRVDTGKCLPYKHFSFMVKNPNYDPDNFSQEIEDSEEEINTLAEIRKEPGFDWVWNGMIGNIPKNSERWLDNHSKKCQFKLLGNVFLSSCSTHIITTTLSSGESSEAMVRDYDNDFTMNKILDVEKEYGEIYEVI